MEALFTPPDFVDLPVCPQLASQFGAAEVLVQVLLPTSDPVEIGAASSLIFKITESADNTMSFMHWLDSIFLEYSDQQNKDFDFIVSCTLANEIDATKS